MGSFYARLFFRVTYLLGLGFLLNYFLMQQAASNLEMIVGNSPFLLWIAVGLIVVSFIGEFINFESLPKTLRVMGLMTLIPGTFAAVILIRGKTWIFVALERVYILNTQEAGRLINFYLDNAIPDSWIIVIAYIIIGAVFYLSGRRHRF